MDEMAVIFKDYPRRVALHLEALYLKMAEGNMACFADNMTCAYRYVLQKACLNDNTEGTGFDELRENIKAKLSGEITKEELQQFVAMQFGFVQGKLPLTSSIDSHHPNIIKRPNSPCRNILRNNTIVNEIRQDIGDDPLFYFNYEYSMNPDYESYLEGSKYCEYYYHALSVLFLYAFIQKFNSPNSFDWEVF